MSTPSNHEESSAPPSTEHAPMLGDSAPPTFESWFLQLNDGSYPLLHKDSKQDCDYVWVSDEPRTDVVLCLKIKVCGLYRLR